MFGFEDFLRERSNNGGISSIFFLFLRRLLHRTCAVPTLKTLECFLAALKLQNGFISCRLSFLLFWETTHLRFFRWQLLTYIKKPTLCDASFLDDSCNTEGIKSAVSDSCFVNSPWGNRKHRCRSKPLTMLTNSNASRLKSIARSSKETETSVKYLMSDELDWKVSFLQATQKLFFQICPVYIILS